MVHSCRQLNRERTQAGASYQKYRREYKRVNEAWRRGTISDDLWDLWRGRNTPADWQPLEDWKRRHDRVMALANAPERSKQRKKGGNDG